MAKITGKYEVLYIIDPTLGEEGTAALAGHHVREGVVCTESLPPSVHITLGRPPCHFLLHAHE